MRCTSYTYTNETQPVARSKLLVLVLVQYAFTFSFALVIVQYTVCKLFVSTITIKLINCIFLIFY